MPLMVLFRSASGVTEFTGTLLRRKGRKEVPVPVLVADRAHFAEACGIVPERPLDSKTSYRAEFTWQEGGATRTRTVRFQTR